MADRAALLRNYGWRQQYLSELHSTNSRLDELQAAVLAAKLGHLDEWNARRRELAALYREHLSDVPGLVLPSDPGASEGQSAGGQPGATEHVHHLFVVRVPGRRDELRAFLAERGIGTGVHYPAPAHLQAPYAEFGGGPGSLPHTEQLAREVLSLPMYPELRDEDVAYAAEQVRAFFRRGA